ncbi:MAG: molybdopterin cofactor-binding domain-containing protein, partial [Burkholderiales bacterium]
LAVAAEREEQAIKAAQALRASAKWNETPDLPPGGSGGTAGAALYEHLKKMPSRDMVIKTVTPTNASGGKITSVEAEYTRPFQAHGSIGPSCAVAQFKDGKYTVWTHSQGVFPLRNDLAKALKTPIANITCTHVEGSGCYGHNGADDVACDAALLARTTSGRPVKLQWMREDEFGWEPFGSAMIMKMQAHLDESKNIVNWQHETWSHPHSTRPMSNPAGSFVLGGWHLANPVPAATPNNSPQPSGAADRNAVPLYDFPRQNILLHYLTDMPVRTSALRTLGAYSNVFALESFIDETALAAGVDPVEFRLRHMKNPRARAVIELAAQKAGWKANAGATKGNGSTGRGIAFAQYKNLAAYCAVVADVTVDRNGNVKVTRAVSVVDAGLTVNPDGIINQIEGGIIQSASWTLKEQVKFDRQRITTRSWADYPIFTFNDVPAVEVHIINMPNERSLGVGEGSQGPTAAAIANAIANATGKRLRDLPFTPDKVKAALA